MRLLPKFITRSSAEGSNKRAVLAAQYDYVWVGLVYVVVELGERLEFHAHLLRTSAFLTERTESAAFSFLYLLRECVEVYSEDRAALVQHPCHHHLLGSSNDTKTISKRPLTTGYLPSVHAVAGCATGSTRPKRCPCAGRASRPLPSFPCER
jgi:hypothetical protein